MTALELLGWVGAISLSLILMSIAVLVMVGAVLSIAKPERRRSVRARKVSPKE